MADAAVAKTDYHLRVYISDAGSTVIAANDSTPICDLLANVCAKRGLNAADLKISLVYKDGKDEANPNPTMPLGFYPGVDFAKVVLKETGLYMQTNSQNNLTGSMGNLHLGMAGPKVLKEEVRSGVFPKTFSHFTTSAGGMNIANNAKFAASLFTRSHLLEEGSSSSTGNRISMPPSSMVTSMGTASFTVSETTSMIEREEALHPDHKSDRKMSEASERLVQRTGSLASMASNVERLERSDSQSKPAFLANSVALKRTTIRSGRSRANTEGIQEISSRKSTDSVAVDDKPDKQYTVLIITLPNFRSISIRAPSDLPMDAILSYVCENHNIEFESHTFQRNDTKDTIVEMDRTLGYLANELKVSEIFIVPEDKVYRSKYMSEGGVDVMMLQTIQGKLLVMAGAPQKLIARLTEQEYKDDNSYIETFLLTFRYFMPAHEFFQQLVSRYNCILPENASTEDTEFFNQQKIPTQTCVVAILKRWVQNHWHDFALDAELKEHLIQFAEEYLYNEDANIRAQSAVLKNLIEDQTVKYEEMYSYYKMVERKGKVLESMILELAPDVLSLQICIHNFKLFKNIHPIEFLHQIWGSDREMTPYLNFFIDRFDKESYWVATEIVMQKDIKKRIKVLSTFILTTKACQEANNFFTLFSFMSGLGLSPVSRLKKTWEGLPEKSKTVYAELEKIIDPSRNMKNYRDLLAKAIPPIVPFLPIYLKDLTFMNDGNTKMVEGMINFEKLRMMGNRVNDIVSLVGVEYKGKAESPIQNYIAKPPVEKNMAKLKEMSVECEK
ncbi:ras guanine nucleotide exchange factor domain-containing protein [Chytriomyces sp. MP71]|nr:ras guanine nucleotide exchange factor domain-containing protein [Chytriomyces sp. MP71]